MNKILYGHKERLIETRTTILFELVSTKDHAFCNDNPTAKIKTEEIAQ